MNEHAPLPDNRSAALEFLLNRRSCPAKMLRPPVPSDDELKVLLTAAARCPDHGKLEPWRFIVIRKGAMERLANAAEARARAAGLDDERVAKSRNQFDTGTLAVAVIEVLKPSDKVPAIEQTYSAGAVCLSLLNAALAAGWGANWLTGWPSQDRTWTRETLGLEDRERVVGIVHIGTPTSTVPDRPRPDVSAITSWLDE